MIESPLIRACCCTTDYEMELMRVDRSVRSSIRESLKQHVGFGAHDTTLKQVVGEVYDEIGYDLSDLDLVSKFEKLRMTNKEWDALLLEHGVTVEYLETKIAQKHTTAKIIPKFAAACVLQIRAKLGVLANNEANVLLVQRKYLELTRHHKVRDVDIVLHQQFVINAVFTEGVLDDTASVRRRLPRWIKWLNYLDSVETNANAVC